MEPEKQFSGVAKLQERYRLIAKLGAGGMADVFLGVQHGVENFQRLVVIKRIHSLWLGKDEAVKMFIDEARTVASLSHPHVVKIYDLSKLGNDVCISMEYVDGENLEYLIKATKLARDRIPTAIVCKMMLEACEALHYAHTARDASGRPLELVHRDIGPNNLMLDSNGYLKVIDFGIAKSSARAELTTPGLVKGKFSYMAPDVFKTTSIDGRVDLYALGLVFFELLTLKRAFVFKKDATIAEVFQRIMNDPVPPPSSIRPDLPKLLDTIIARAVHKNRDERYPSCEALATDIRAFATQFSGLASNSEVEAWFRKKFGERIAKRREFERKTLEKAKSLSAQQEEMGSSTTPLTPGAAMSNLEGAAPSLPPSPTGMTGAAALGAGSAVLGTGTGALGSQTGALPPARHVNWYLLSVLIFLLVAGTVVLVHQLFFVRSAPEPAAPAPIVAPPPKEEAVAAKPEETIKPLDISATEEAQKPAAQPEPATTPPTEEPAAKVAAEPATKHPPRHEPSRPTRKEPTRPERNEPKADEPAAVPVPKETALAFAKIPEPTAPTVKPEPVKAEPPKPASQPEPEPEPGKKVALYSGAGNWSGEQAIQQGCNRCHGGKAPAIDFKAKTPSQWKRFFTRGRHDRYLKLEQAFSKGELKRAEAYVLSQIQTEKQIGITGVK